MNVRGLDNIGARDYMVWRNRLVQWSRCGFPFAYKTDYCECGNHRCLLFYRVIDGDVEDLPLLTQDLNKTTHVHTYLGDVERLDAEYTAYALYQLEMAGEL